MRRGPLLGAVAAVVAAGYLLTTQPLEAPWWNWADPDGPYVGSSVNILLGNHTSYLDHPGLPTQDALALGFGAWYLVENATGAIDDRQAFADERMLDLDRTRWLYRGWALLLFLAATLIVYAVVGRLLGHWTWGLAGAVLFLSSPELAAIAPLLRPDAMLAALCLLAGYLVVTGFERRSAVRYAAAALVVGLAMTFKIPAVGMLVPLAVAAVWRPPGAGWASETATTLRAHMHRHALWLVPVAVAWIVLCWLFNRERLPIVQTDDQRNLLLTGATFLVGYAAFAFATERLRIPWADRIFRLSYAWILAAFALGLLLPATLVLDDGIQMLVRMQETLTGGSVNEGIEPFADFELGAFFESPRSVAGAIMALGLVAGAVGAVRRCWWPLLLAAGTLVLGTMAAARYSFHYYYLPAIALAIPGALWLVQRLGRRVTPVLVWVPVLFAFWWATTHQTAELEQATNRAIDASAQELADDLLEDGQVVLVPEYYFPIEDVRFDTLVDGFVDHVPAFPYRFVHRPGTAVEHGLTPAYYVTWADALPAERSEVTVGGVGPFLVEPLPLRFGPSDEYRVARIVSSPPLEP